MHRGALTTIAMGSVACNYQTICFLVENWDWAFFDHRKTAWP
jgi:hypothetical protein